MIQSYSSRKVLIEMDFYELQEMDESNVEYLINKLQNEKR